MTDLRKRPRQKRSEAMVDVILEAAARILEDDGFSGLTTNAVARKAGVSVGSLYQYFASKEAILTEMVRRDHLALLSDLTCAAEEVADAEPEEAVRALIRVGVDRQLTRPKLARALDFAETGLGLDAEALATVQAIEAIGVRVLGAHFPALGRRNLYLAAADIGAMAKGMIDAAGQRGETGRAALTARVTRAVLGYLQLRPTP